MDVVDSFVDASNMDVSTNPMKKIPLTKEKYKTGLDILSKCDPDLGRIIKKNGPPPMWNREPGFATLIHIVLEQQVSLASAKAAFDRLNETLPKFTPNYFLRVSDLQLKKIGFSRQKTRYAQNIAMALINGEMNLDDLSDKPDEIVRERLQKIKGIGPWTADIYLLMALKRPDIWPSGDLALISALQDVKDLRERPSAEDSIRISVPWKPWRAIAARILWHHYLSK